MIYLDNNATTKPSQAVVDSVVKYLSSCYFNPAAAGTAFTGADVPRQTASSALARLFNAEGPECFIFTSGATESNNWVFSSMARSGKPAPIIISAIEHPSVSEPAAELEERLGFEVIELPVTSQGVVRLDLLREFLRAKPVLVSVMAANNETGAVQPIASIGRLIREVSPNSKLHTDATQAVGKIPIDLQADWSEVDWMSFSAHKFHGPKGVGGLYVRPGSEIVPIILGGGQEEGLRSGTTNTAGLAGLAQASLECQSSKTETIEVLRNNFEANLKRRHPEVVIHSEGTQRLPNTSFFSLPTTSAGHLVARLSTLSIIAATGSACSAGAIAPSKTLRAMGIDHDVANAAVRVTLSRNTTKAELEVFLTALESVVTESDPLDSDLAGLTPR